MFNKFTLLQSLAVTTIFAIFGAVVILPKFVNAQNASGNTQPPDELLGNNTRFVGSLIPPSGAVKYVVLPPGEKITGRLGLPAAQLIKPPAEVAQEIAVWVPPKTTEPFRPEEISYEIISSTRYRGNGHTIFVTTARPSPGAAKFKQYFGHPDKLADGTPVGVKIDCESPDAQTSGIYSCVSGSSTPNQVQFMRGNLIITVASDLPLDQVKELARNASLK